ncbi:MAG: inositol monophosphatase [SAR202 cluster bacterium]|nr:inositol monophosphatase [SAR202 cluster bacterium]
MNGFMDFGVPPSKSGRSALEIAIDAAKAAGSITRARVRDVLEVSFKGRGNPVTDVDKAAEKAALSILRREYPEFGIQAEESPRVDSSTPYRWIVDPLDGTRNYVVGIPHFCTAVALARGDDVLAAATYDPLKEELFQSVKGGGAFLNGRRLRVTAKKSLEDCVVGFDMGYSDERARQGLELVRHLWPGFQSLRLMGSAALGMAYAACGRMDVYFHHRLAPWDVAGGLLLVREAGGVALDRYGKPATPDSESVVASSGGVVEGFMAATEGLDWRR